MKIYLCPDKEDDSLMKDFFLKYLASTRLMSVLFFVFPAAMGLGTFIETWYSTDTAKIWIYNAWWFELIMALFVLNFIGNIFRYRLLRKEKWAVLAIHISFILILIGAFVTRYIGYEGVMPIREGDSTNTFLSEKTLELNFRRLYIETVTLNLNANIFIIKII